MALFRCNEVVTDVSTLKLKRNYVNEGKLPDLTSIGIDIPGRALGYVEGIGFMGDFASGNDRWYPSELWQKTCSADYVTEQIASMLMFGEVGHPDDDDGVVDWKLGKGLYSHCISKLDYSNDPTGIIGFYIMDSDAGKNLYSAYAIGSRLSVSSRAMADYVVGQTHNGMPIMDPDQYWLDTFDIVRVPGIAVATPSQVQLFDSVQGKIKEAQSKPSKVQIAVPNLKTSAKEAVKEAKIQPTHKKPNDYTNFLI